MCSGVQLHGAPHVWHTIYVRTQPDEMRFDQIQTKIKWLASMARLMVFLFVNCLIELFMPREDDDAYSNISELLALNELSKVIRKAEKRQPVMAHSHHHSSIGENRIKYDF